MGSVTALPARPSPALVSGDALVLEGVTRSFGALKAIDDVSFNVTAGERRAVLGANGAGKTTLLRTISGLVAPTAGRVRMADREITGMPVAEIVRYGLAHVPEGRGVIAELTVEENLRLGGLWRKRAAADPAEIYDLFPRHEERRSQPASRLSGGERQMLSIGRALMARPRALLLDEPSLGLAPLIVRKIFQIIREINSQGTTIFLVEQNAHMALTVAHRAYVLQTGRVIKSDKASSLLQDPDVRKAYLGG